MTAYPRALNKWVSQVGTLTVAALAVFWSLYALDHYLAQRHPAGLGRAAELTPFTRYFSFESDKLTDAVSSLSGFMAAVFGIVVTVVSIVVQLSANRYRAVARMFLADRLNRSVMTFYIIACVCGVWLSPSLQSGYVAGSVLVAMLAMSTLGLVVMAPYFGYIFWFLEPMNIIQRIRGSASQSASRGAKGGQELAHEQAKALAAMEELTDIAANSIAGKDKIIASGAVDALKDFAEHYITHKGEAQPAWFQVGERIAKNPDFVAMDPESLRELEARKNWVEWKVMRQYLRIFAAALSELRDINYLIAIDTRYLGEAALKAKDDELVALVLRFMNSYMRSTLNAGDVRTAYNVLNQYRLLAEAMLRQGDHQAALESVRFMKYYGYVSFDLKLTFVTETVAYDVSSLCELASELDSPSEELILKEFLELDRPLLEQGQEKGLLGVRKAQVKLACYYLERGHTNKAKSIAEDMRNEPAQRLQTIQRQLQKVTSKDFWEVIDRGRNFEYMPAERRTHMGKFFAWL